MNSDHISYQTNSSHITEQSTPDAYEFTEGKAPPDTLVISRDRDGTPLSLYGDLEWDWTPYHSEGRKRALIFKFWKAKEPTFQQEDIAREMRWLVFLLIQFKQGGTLSVGTLKYYVGALRSMARFCDSCAISLNAALAAPERIAQFAQIDAPKMVNIASLIAFLHKLGPGRTGFEIVNKAAVKRLQEEAQKWTMDHKKQCAPIPTRIYTSIISTLAQELSIFEKVMDRLLQLFQDCTEDRYLGRHRSTQLRKRKLDKSEKSKPGFRDLLCQHELDEFWKEREYIESIQGLPGALSEAMLVCTLLIQAFTGMRRNEVISLPYNCLSAATRNGTTHYIVKGRVTKSTKGKARRVQWVTNESGRSAILLAQRIAKAAYTAYGMKPQSSNDHINDHYLFVTVYPALCDNVEFKNLPNLLIAKYYKSQYRRLQVNIEEEDLRELERIDPYRAWRTESAFQLGQPWPFISHQLRRSLALYAQRSGLVSLPSLKRQLQHITQEMSLYYANGSAFAKNFIGDSGKEKHFGEEWQNAQPVSQYLSYATHVLFADENDLFGVHPHWIKHRLRNEDGIVLLGRDETLDRFKKGEMAYRETILGGCVKVGECDKNPLDLLHVDCITTHCNNMVGSKKKLERVITIQASLVQKLERDAAFSSEYRHEKANLKILVTTLENVSKGINPTKEAA
ncbi:hypothetical protein Q8A64_02270 [Oxalobacteraceae bacterium R-40]|uniref:Integrase n=1 Tax=Keguizhuia sedimenti TaxID=3064264 RepID=A0ABU1BK32_9BURK|nr:hypothetical protein [Oxalobacteraceae bacterium R-40]